MLIGIIFTAMFLFIVFQELAPSVVRLVALSTREASTKSLSTSFNLLKLQMSPFMLVFVAFDRELLGAELTSEGLFP